MKKKIVSIALCLVMALGIFATVNTSSSVAVANSNPIQLYSDGPDRW